MARDRDKPVFHPSSPVQPGQSNTPYFVAAFFAAAVIWTAQQLWVQDSNPAPPVTSAQLKDVAKPASGDVRMVFTSDDYPAEAQRNGDEGTVQARLDVNPQGRVSRCIVVVSSGHASLDEATCAILQRRARFKPARDVKGKPIPDSFLTPKIIWRLEG